jgi:transketolase
MNILTSSDLLHSNHDLKDIANHIRKLSLRAAHAANLGHPGGDLSCADILAVLVGRYVHCAKDTKAPDRNRFIMSKGHAALAYYSSLHLAGLISLSTFETFAKANSDLSGHPASVKIEAIETSTGPLGHGLPIAAGMALAARMQTSSRKVFVLCGDGEMQEGSNWEAVMLASHHSLTNLCCIVDRNRLQHSLSTEDVVSLDRLSPMFEGFGWASVIINGNDVGQCDQTFAQFEAGEFDRPLAIIAETVKGSGVSFMENCPEWHHRVPNDVELFAALEELGATNTARAAV